MNQFWYLFDKCWFVRMVCQQFYKPFQIVNVFRVKDIE